MKKSSISKDFWASLESLDIYKKSQEALSDQLDETPPGGSNPSDADIDSDESKEQNNDADLGMDDALDMGGDDLGATGGEGEPSADGASGDAGAVGSSEVKPEENPFMGENGKIKLDSQLADLQTAINDTLNRIHANTKVGSVVVSDVENLADSVKKIRENVFIVPIESSLYKYRIAVISYKMLSDRAVDDLKSNQNSI